VVNIVSPIFSAGVWDNNYSPKCKPSTCLTVSYSFMLLLL